MHTPLIDAQQHSFFGQLLLELQKRITEQVPEIKFIEQDFGQLEAPDELGRYPVSFPCVLVDFTDTQYSDLSNNVQEADNCFIDIRLGFPSFSFSSSLQNETVRKKGLQYYELENLLYKALHAWAPVDLCQPLTRRNAITEKRDDGLRVRVLRFSTRFEDHNAVPVKTNVPRPALDIDFENS